MKKVVFVGVVAVLLLGLLPMGVLAQSATSQTWSTSITYYTPSATGGTLQIRYYAEGSSTPINATPITLQPNKAGSLFIGSVAGIPDPFKGAAVLEADVPIIATAVNIAGGGDYPRPLYTGFDPSKASDDFKIPTVLKKFGATSLISIQNTETSQIQATLKVFPKGSTTPTVQQTYTIPGQSAKLVSADDLGLTDFDGSGVVEATGKVVAAVQETADSGLPAAAFEGLPADAGATTIYMASMLCEKFNATSFYAIQNAGTSQATVAIDYYDTAGVKLLTTQTFNIAVGSKESKNPCSDGVSAGTNGSAVIRSTNGVPLIAVGKVSGANLTTTAFLGESAGATKVGAAYIRWKTDATQGERANIAVMNVGSADATDVKVMYYNNQGNLAATQTLASGGSPLGRFIKANSNWETASGSNTDFGVNPYGGATQITSDQPVVVVVRISKQVGGTTLAEDYNGVPLP
jgi:hypothetical protein